MATSESEEDFESADEDLDVDNLRESKTKKEVVQISELNDKDTNKNISSGAKSVYLLSTVGKNNLTDHHDTEQKPEVECSPDNNMEKSVDIISLEAEKTKVKPTVKKLGKPIVQQESQSKSKLDNQSKNELPIEGEVNRTKFGVTLSSEEVKSNVNVGNDDVRISLVKNTDLKTEEILKNNEKISFCKDDVKLKSAIKPSEDNLETEETNFEAGDGWELEEEDGFEVPVALARNGDGGIQCPQEQISELNQVDFRPSKVEQEQEQGWGKWGGWGVSSLLSTASGTVTTLSSHVTAGFSTVLETTVGAPDPETLASQQASQQGINEEQTKAEHQTGVEYGGLGSIMSGVSFLGSSVINRGLDTLETIGKKTMEVLQEGDPGLKKKRAMLFQDEDKPILSQILREAKDRADNSDKEKEEKEAARKIHFESLFDDFQGMVHLEALEMLSTQCELKLQLLLQSSSGSELLDLQETLSQVRELCELGEEEEDTEVLTVEQFAEKVAICVEGLQIKITPTKVIKVNGEISERLEQQPSAAVVNQLAISSLAEFTAAAMEYFHKSAELVMANTAHNTANEADSYIQLTNHLCARISAMANEFSQILTKNDPIANSSLITNIFLEASNSCSYIKNACQLLVPILQVGAVAT